MTDVSAPDVQAPKDLATLTGMSTPSAGARPAATGPLGLPPGVAPIAVVTILGAFMSILDTSIVNVALETLSRDLRAPLDDVQWVATAYLLSLAAVIPVTGWAARRFGSRRIFLTSLVLFTLGSALCGLAWNVESLVVFRVLQGLGGGMLMPIGQLVMARAAGPKNMGRVMAVTGVPIVLAPVLGPVLGGVLIEGLSWHWIFFVNVPVGAVALFAAIKLLPRTDEAEEAGRLDAVGLALLAIGLPLLIFGVSEYGSKGEVTTLVWTTALAGAVLIASFVSHALRVPNPLLELRLFKDRAFAAAMATTFSLGAVLFGALIVLPLYYQVGRGESTIQAGLLLAPQGIGAAIAMPLSGRLTDRFGGGPIAMIGITVVTLATVPFIFVGAQTSFVLLSVALVIRGMGMGFSMMPSFSAAFARLDRSQVADATPQLNVLNRVGGSFGTAILSVILASQLSGARSPEALADGFGTTFLWATIISAVGIVPCTVLFFTERTARRNEAAAEARAASAAAMPPEGEQLPDAEVAVAR